MSMKNLLWICIDSLRQDHVCPYSEDGSLTPNIQSVADTGHAFTNCHSSGIKTPAATTSILTGTHPMYHGVNGNPDDESAKVLDSEIETVADRLNAEGYNTGAVSRNVHVSEYTKKDRGFDDFTWLEQNPVKMIPQLPWQEAVRYLFSLPSNASALSLNGSMYSTAPAVTRRVCSLLDKYEKLMGPYFIYAHYNEVHRPYIPPRKELKQDLPDGWSRRQAVKTSLQYHNELYDIIVNNRSDDIDDNLLKYLYKAEIKHVDRYLKHIIERVDFEETVVVITGDHGEYLGEFGLYGHQLLPLDEVTRVPLVVTGLAEDGINTDQLCQHIDLISTFFDEMGIRFEQLQGKNLYDEKREYALTEYHTGLSVFKQYNPDLNTSWLYPSYVRSLRSDEYRYIENAEKSNLYLPGEIKPFQNKEKLEKYHSVMEQFRKEYEREERIVKGDVSEGMKSHLADLGYLG